MKPLRVMHLANHLSKNIGNAALIYGLERVLQEDMAREIQFVREDWDQYREIRPFDGRFVERVNELADVLLVGAAVSFDGRPIYGNTGFRFNLPLELWPEVQPPIVFYGLSYRAWKDREYAHADALRRAFDHILASDRVLFSARNDDTKEWLEGMLGYASDRILVAPDPAVYMPTEDAWHPELDPAAKNVIVAVNAEDEEHRWSRGEPEPHGWIHALPSARLRRKLAPTPAWRRRRERFVSELAAALDRVAADEPINVVVCPHTFGDVGMSYELVLALSEELKLRTAIAPSGLPVTLGPYFYDLYAKADLALSMRIHSMNPAIGIGTPVIPLVSQSRMAKFMRDAGLERRCVDVFSPSFVDDLVGAMRDALARPEVRRDELREVRDGLRERTRAFNALVDGFVEARVPAAAGG